jgi:hypothetical protein|tara:strand:+ start:80 stop:238 length:159 start_codon:yes stop_codon:yes gene_type:complete
MLHQEIGLQFAQQEVVDVQILVGKLGAKGVLHTYVKMVSRAELAGSCVYAVE